MKTTKAILLTTIIMAGYTGVVAIISTMIKKNQHNLNVCSTYMSNENSINYAHHPNKHHECSEYEMICHKKEE